MIACDSHIVISGIDDCKDCKETIFCTQLSVTISCKTCQRWDSQYPHKHTRNDPSAFPCEHLEDAANYCRNPDNGPGGPWCYTTDRNKRWEHCEVNRCGKYIILNVGLFIRISMQTITVHAKNVMFDNGTMMTTLQNRIVMVGVSHSWQTRSQKSHPIDRQQPCWCS